MDNETPRSSALSPPPPPNSAQPWAQPRSRLEPHRLAKLANALGVSTPLPAHHAFAASAPNLGELTPASASPASSFPDRFVRSPTPSSASTAAVMHAQPTSRFLLHVVPPADLPHTDDDADAPLPPGTPGYHPHFQRGVLVPVYATLGAQLHAIAKEYALPSSAGLLLYLVSSATAARGPDQPNADEEPGPCLSEHVWRHIWSRVVRAERQDAQGGPSRAATPMLGFNLASSPLSAVGQEPPWQRSPVTRVLSPKPRFPEAVAPAPAYPITPSPSSTSSESYRRPSLESQTSASLSLSLPDRPFSDVDSDAVVIEDAPDLPGLRSTALVPVLAKVELVIDPRKAPWFDHWLRSRRQQHARRAESRMGSRPSTANPADDDDSDTPAMPLLDLELVNRKTLDPFKALMASAATDDEEEDDALAQPEDGYAPLDEDGADEDEAEDAAPTTRGPSMVPGDPLADVFGTDEETWAEIRAQSRPSSQQLPPGVVPLVLDAASLSTLPSLDEAGLESTLSTEDEADLNLSEVEDLWNAHSRPRFSGAAAEEHEAARKRASSTSTSATVKKSAPPPLILPPLPSVTVVAETEFSPSMTLSAVSSSTLPYLSGGPGPSPLAQQFELASPADSPADVTSAEDLANVTSPTEKRGGGFYEDLDFDPQDDPYDENDPDDLRRSQYLLQAQLDEVEKTLAQFSPRKLEYEPDAPRTPSAVAAHFLPETSRGDGSVGAVAPTGVGGAQWPAVPYSALASATSSAKSGGGMSNSPPRLAINGVTKDVPVVPASSSGNNSRMNESRQRRERLEQDALYYPVPQISPSRNYDSPVIPLSPDPFGRFSSSLPPPGATPGLDPRTSYFSDASVPPLPTSSPSRSIVYEPSPRDGRSSATPSSRFSSDSQLEEDAKATKGAGGAALPGVKGIQKLWRKSNKASISAPGSASGSAPLAWVGEPPGPAPAPLTAGPAGGFDLRLPPNARAQATYPSPSQPPPSPPQNRLSARKSILKAWKTHGPQGSLSAGSVGATDLVRAASESAAEPPKRRRRPSLFETASAVMRTSSHAAADLLPSPHVREQNPQGVTPPPPPQTGKHHRRQSSATSVRLRHPSTPTQPPAPPLPGSPARAGGGLRTSAASPSRSRGSDSPRQSSDFDTSEFEMVRPAGGAGAAF